MKMRKLIGKIAAMAALLFTPAAFAGGGSLTFSPTILPDATVGVAYEQAVTITSDMGISSARGVSGLPTGLSARIAVKDSAITLTVQGTPTVAGTSTITVTVLLGDRKTITSGTISLTVKDGSGGGGATTPTLERTSPASQSVSMTVGDKQNFKVTAKDVGSATLYWYIDNIRDDSTTGAEFEYSPSSAGSHTVECRAVQTSGTGGVTTLASVSWNVAVSAAAVTFLRKSPALQTVSMSVGDTQVFQVEASGSTSGISYSWNVSSGSGGSSPKVTPLADNPLACSFTPESAGTYYVIFNYGSGSQVYWMVTVAAGAATPEVQGYTPASDTVVLEPGEKADLSVSVKNASSGVLYVWSEERTGTGFTPVSSGTDIYAASYTYNPTSVDARRVRVVVSSSDGKTVYGEKIWTISVNAPKIVSITPTPLYPVEMANGEKQTFSITLDKTDYDSLNYNWYWCTTDNSWWPFVYGADNSRSYTYGSGHRKIKVEVYANNLKCAEQIWELTPKQETTLPRLFPVDSNMTMTLGNRQMFRVMGEEVTDSATNYWWYVDGVCKAAGHKYYEYYPGLHPGVHTIECRLADNKSHEEEVVYASTFWTVTTTETDPALYERVEPAEQGVRAYTYTDVSFSVKANGEAGGEGYKWVVMSEDDPNIAFKSSDGLSSTLNMTKPGVYYVAFVYGENRLIRWTVTALGGSGNKALVRINPADEEFYMFAGDEKTFELCINGSYSRPTHSDPHVFWEQVYAENGVMYGGAMAPVYASYPSTDINPNAIRFVFTTSSDRLEWSRIKCHIAQWSSEDGVVSDALAETFWDVLVLEKPNLARFGEETDVTVNVGEGHLFSVTQTGCDGHYAEAHWYVNGQIVPEQNGKFDFTYTPPIKGNYAVECKAETRNTDGSWRTLSTVAWTVRAIYGEKAYIPVPLPDSEVLGEVFAHRVSLKPGEFSKPIRMANGVAGYSKFNVIGSLPAGVTLSADGVLSGTMNDDLNGEEIQLELVYSTLPPIVNTFTNRVTLTLVKRKLENTWPYFSYADPAEDEVEAFIDNAKVFTACAFDEEEETVTYKWFLDGVEQTGVPHGNRSLFTLNDKTSAAGSTHDLYCCATDRDSGYSIIKSWNVTMRQPTFAIATTSLPHGTAGNSMDSIPIGFVFPGGTSIAGLDVVDGKLPIGWTPFSNGYIAGAYRKAGSYTFTLRATCSNGETAEKTYTVNVAEGADFTPRTWKVVNKSGGGIKKMLLLGKGGSGDDATEVQSITQALQQGAAEGDTIEVETMDDSMEDLAAFKYLKGINVKLKANVLLDVGEKAPDLTAFTKDGGTFMFKMSEPTGGYYGDKVRIAKVGTDKDVSDFTVYYATAPYYFGGVAIDDEGWLYTHMACFKATQDTDRLILPDDISRRNVAFSGATFLRNVIVSSEGVLPGSITFSGVNNFAAGCTFDLAFLEDVKTVVKSGAVLAFGNGASLADSKFGGLELEGGAVLQFNPNGTSNMLLGYRMSITGEGKVLLSLTAAMESGKSCTVSSRYIGDNDPMNVFEIVPTGSAVAYRLYRGGENALVLAAETAPNPGELDWTEAVDMNGTLGSSFSRTFAAQGPKGTNPRTGEEYDLYSDFTYTLLNSAYIATRTGDKTFNESVGERELLQGAYRYGASGSSTTTEIGFPFPCGPSFASKVTVASGGRVSVGGVTVALLDKGFLPGVQGTFAHVYIVRTEDAFTVRYARFGSVTLTRDGKVRVAFGPDADLQSAGDPQGALCYMMVGGERIDFSSAESYASANDIILVPNCPPGLTLSSDGVLSGRPLVAGDYSLDVKVTAKDAYSNTYTTTRTFNLAIADADISEPAMTVIDAPEVADDGYVHIPLGGTANFEVSVEGGDGMRWMLDGICVSSAGKYTLTAPETRSLDAVGARIHRLAAETADGAVCKVWYVVYNRRVYVDANSAAGAGGGSSSGGGDGAAGTGGTIIGEDGSIITGGGGEGGTGGGTTADGLTPETAFADFQEGMFRYLLNGDEVVVAPGTYRTPIDFYNNDAKVAVSATGATLDLAGNTKGYTRCFRQGRYELSVGRSGFMEVLFLPVNEATVGGLVLRGGAIAEDGDTNDNSVNYYGVVGGGAFGGSFTNCVITGCDAKDYGGGAYGAVLDHCIVEDCAAAVGGGCANCKLSFCTVVGNVATSAAGGVDGECEACYSIIVGNEAAGKASEYAATTTPVKLTPQVPTIDNCFTEGDPLFGADYHLTTGSPAAGMGACPEPDATECRVFVEVEGGGAVSPNDAEGTLVEVGGNIEFEASGRDVAAIYVNGAKVADGPVGKWTLENVEVNTTVRFVFAPATLLVGAGGYGTVSSAIAAARSGDTIKVEAGTYEDAIDVRAFAGTLTIEAANPGAKPVIDARGGGRCVTAVADSDNVIFKDIIFANGMAEMVSSGALPFAEWLADGIHGYTDAQLLDFGFGGGVFGGRYENCVITNCTAIGSMGGGAFRATLVGCEVVGNSAGQKVDSDIYRDLCGGGVFGGLVQDCRVHDNLLLGYRNQVYCRYRGAGTFGAEVRNSFVWDNYINCGSTDSAIPSETHVGTDGVTVHTVEKAPTPTQLENHKTPIAVDGESPTYASFDAARTAADKQVADIPTPVARAIANYDDYVGLFDIATVSDGNSGWVNKPVLKESVIETIHEQAMDALTKDDSGEPRESFQVQKMEKTLTNTIPGLYYALEFSGDLSSDSFVGERHLSTGSGSMKLSATSLDSPSGFWRMAVYLTPDGE